MAFPVREKGGGFDRNRENLGGRNEEDEAHAPHAAFPFRAGLTFTYGVGCRFANSDKSM